MRPIPRQTLAVAIALLPLAAAATEGGMGRPITAQQVYSDAGVVPPTPGLVLAVSSIYFSGDLSGSRLVSVGRTLSAGLDVSASYNIANLTYIWNTGPGRWNFASAIGLPVQYTKAEIDVGGLYRGVSRSDSNTHFADVLVNPIVAGYHFSETEHIAFSLPFYAPTGSYDPDRLANAGQNTWTFSPTIAYTKLFAGGGQFTTLGAVDFYTRNDDTDYKNGAVFRIDAMWTTAVAPQWQLGVVGGWIEQLQNDKGPTADKLNGFKGRAVGLGPILTWSGKIGSQPAAFSARWVHDVEAKNRPKGDGVSVSLTLPFL
ncbi:transporter [Variovorax sp. J22P168]|uniref:SphA family protein n=1 Tax=Variovorax jilinensis TaxID=3053513 RepID=UPI002574A63D|nr:transporter [Variovorax sp. J22P168]MDM0011314.1 transporter [Variovorax sp. J22P168]